VPDAVEPVGGSSWLPSKKRLNATRIVVLPSAPNPLFFYSFDVLANPFLWPQAKWVTQRDVRDPSWEHARLDHYSVSVKICGLKTAGCRSHVGPDGVDAPDGLGVPE
jgi:hypothetical protein